MVTHVLRFARASTSRWWNNGGVTHEIARRTNKVDTNAFDWRISVADVTAPGPFSHFPGIDRVLIFCEGQEMSVTVDGLAHDLSRWTLFYFSGDADVSGAVPSGATRDLNIMTNRALFRTTTHVDEFAGSHTVVAPDSTELVVVVVEGSIKLTGKLSSECRNLGTYDAFTMSGPGTVVVEGSARLVTVQFHLIDDTL